ncbi:MAG: fumarate hydratase C-terminal domain-containing protein [Pseudomonadota bacterium]
MGTAAAAGSSPRKIRLSTTPTADALAGLRLGDIVYLDGLMYTAREGVYMRAIDERANIPMDLPAQSAANFHCSPAASINADGSFTMGAVTATASFRFSKWIGEWMAKSGAKLIVGKGGMSSADYQKYFVPNGAIYLTTVGYGTGALLGRGVENVEAVHWHEELGHAQAMWVLKCNNMGPFIVASDLKGNCLFERENAKIADRLPDVYAGTRPATLKRYGETDDRSDEVIG